MDQRTDEDLVLALKGGDSGSLGLLVARWEQPLFRFVYRHMPRREEAQDICQETFLRVMKKAHHFRHGGRFSTWMYQIALNLCRDHARKRRRWRLLVEEGDVEKALPPPLPDGSSSAKDPVLEVQRREQREAVNRALESIPPEQREVLVLKEFQGLKFREIAELLGCPESTVKSRMYYGLRGLRGALRGEGVGHGLR